MLRAAGKRAEPERQGSQIIVKDLFARLGLSIDEAAFSRGDAMIAGLSRSFIAFGTAAVAAVAVGMVVLTKGMANAADHVKKLSQSTGVNSITLQEFGYSADLAGVSTDELAQGLRHLAKTGVRDVQGAVLKLADQFKDMPDDGRKVELAMDKFGRAGARLIPWLNGGAKGISDLAQEAHDLGVIFDTEAQDAAEQFNDNITRLNYGMAGLRNTIGSALLPVLNKLVLKMILFVRFIRTNWKPITDNLILTLRTLAFVLGGVVLAALLANIGAAATAASWYVALGIAAAAAAIKAALAWAAAAAPVIILGALIAGLLLIAEDLYYFLTDGDSLIGELGPKWAAFLDDFTKPREEHWLLATLREVLRLLTDVGTAWQHIKDNLHYAGRELFGIPWSAAGQTQAAPQASGPGPWSPNALFGGGSSPAASAAPSQWSPPNWNMSANIQINAAPGQSPQEVANAVTRAMDAHFDQKMRAAASGAQ